MRAEAERILDLLVGASVALGERNPRADMRITAEGRVVMRKVQPVNDMSELIAAVCSDERVIAPMRAIMGDEPVVMEEKLNYKQVLDADPADFPFLAGSDPTDEFQLHHDWGYYALQGYPEETISSAVAIDDTAGRGPIRVIPGSHLLDVPLLHPERLGDGHVVADGFGESDRVAIEVPAGSVLIFHSKLLHDSLPNLSGLPRRVMIYSHYPQSFDGGADADRRNAGIRARGHEHEARYRALLEGRA